MYTNDRRDQQSRPPGDRQAPPAGGGRRGKRRGTEALLSTILIVGVVLAIGVMGWSAFRGASKVPPSATAPTPTPSSSPASDSQATSSVGQPKKVNLAPPSTWKLAFDSNFSGPTLDTSVWATCYWFASTGSGCTNTGNNNEEKEWYQASQDQLNGGVLDLVAKHEPTDGTSAKGKPEVYTCRSGMVTTEPSFNFEYGYVQMVARLPYNNGLWPAFWLAASNKKWPPEIDIFEHWDSETNTGAYLHPLNGVRQGGRVQSMSNLSKGWHTFTLSWTKNKLTWYIDNYQVFSTTTQIPRQDMYLIANVADTSTAATACTGTMQIKSIKVWQPS